MEKYKIVIDNSEFQRKILDFIGTEDFDRFFDSTIYSKEEDWKSYKNAIIYGLCLAGMLTSRCEQFYIKEEIDKIEI